MEIDPKPETIEFVRAAMKQIAHLHRSAFEENQRCDVISFNIKEASGQKGFFCSFRVKFMRFTKQRSPRRRPFARAALTRTEYCQTSHDAGHLGLFANSGWALLHVSFSRSLQSWKSISHQNSKPKLVQSASQRGRNPIAFFCGMPFKI